MLTITTVGNMRLGDKLTIESGVSGEELMLRAARAIYANLPDGRVAIICGGGNNGGDGYALATLLLADGRDTDIFSLCAPDGKSDAFTYYSKVANYVQLFSADVDLSIYDVVADCIFGTGLSRDIEGVYRTAVEKINAEASYVVSADIPSGLNGDNGEINGVCVRADVTVAIGSAKTGYYLSNGKDFCGRVIICDIGIALPDKHISLVEKRDVARLFPKRKNNSHKGTYGKLSIIGGSLEYCGAVKLAYAGAVALRTSCGLCSLCVPRGIAAAVASSIVECTLTPLADVGCKALYDENALRTIAETSDAIAVGMGWGKSEEYAKILEYFITRYRGKLLIDADGLNTLASDSAVLEKAACDIVLTPHIKEFSRLIGKSVAEIKRDPIASAEVFARKYGVTVLLKGTSTIVTDGERTCIVAIGTPAQAKGGSGDVLSGCIGSLLARGCGTYEAAYGGAYLCGSAAEISAREYGEYSALPSDTAANIARVIKEITSE